MEIHKIKEVKFHTIWTSKNNTIKKETGFKFIELSINNNEI